MSKLSLTHDVDCLSGETQFCISLSKQPGRFGTTVHNAGYRALKLNYLYKAFATCDISGAIAGVRALGIRGCSVSMPFKESVMCCIDSFDEGARIIGAVNTIVNDNGCLTGFNTDVTGALMSLTPHLTNHAERIVVLGGGGVARAILQALTVLGQSNITVCVREPDKYKTLANQFGICLMDWSQRQTLDASVLINATPIGMVPHIGEVPIDIDSMPTLRFVMDVIAAPRTTALIKMAEQRNLTVVDGFTMALHQAYEQFYLYTGLLAPREAMYRAANLLS